VIYIITGPSGVGKNTIINELSNHINIHFSVSHTTREKRQGEVDGKDYFFVSEEEFKNLIDKNFFIEFEQYGDAFYGTGKDQIKNKKEVILLDLEVNGATKLLKQYPHFIGIFIDIDNDSLKERLKIRGHDNSFIQERMKLANLQREKKHLYNFNIKNVDLNTSVKEIIDIIYDLEERW